MDINKIKAVIEEINERKQLDNWREQPTETKENLTIKFLTAIYGENLNEGILAEIYAEMLGKISNSEKITYDVQRVNNEQFEGEYLKVVIGDAVLEKGVFGDSKETNSITVGGRNYSFRGNILNKTSYRGTVNVEYDEDGLRKRITAKGKFSPTVEIVERLTDDPLKYNYYVKERVDNEIRETNGQYEYNEIKGNEIEPVLGVEQAAFYNIVDVALTDDKYFPRRREAKERLIAEYKEQTETKRTR